jgi:hypothetical protein
LATVSVYSGLILRSRVLRLGKVATPTPDDDPQPALLDDDVGRDHGTHVAGIVAGKSEW